MVLCDGYCSQQHDAHKMSKVRSFWRILSRDFRAPFAGIIPGSHSIALIVIITVQCPVETIAFDRGESRNRFFCGKNGKKRQRVIE